MDDLTVQYQLDAVTGLVGFLLYPTSFAERLVPPREFLDEPEILKMPGDSHAIRARPVDSLIQAKVSGDINPTGYALGRTLRNSGTTLSLRYDSQEIEETAQGISVTTILRHPQGFEARHVLTWPRGAPYLRIKSAFRCFDAEKARLELLSSFSLGGLTPFHRCDAPNRLWIHRIRSSWSAEGRLESSPAEALHLERSWQGHSVNCERFGQIGSMPARGYFPFAAIEDREAGVTWGAQLAWAGSWEMEIYRQSDAICLSGGLADREFGHWSKELERGVEFCTPEAIISVVAGSVDDLCHNLTQAQIPAVDAQPQIEQALPIICNEFCTSWGNPTHQNLLSLANVLSGTPVKYLVIDAGWYGHPERSWFHSQGDWEPDAIRFPGGIKAACDAIREKGLIPGIWFEFEVAGEDSKVYSLIDHQLKRDGTVVTVAGRRFWDFRKPWVLKFLSEKVITFLRDANIGYLKVDYNETIGVGVDDSDSIGEGLRQHIEAVGSFFDVIRSELPDLVIENCSSGGHRLEPSFLARTSMSSFSDAHETLEAPIVAANLHRVMLPRQEQIWVVLRKEDSPKRLLYTLSTAFLGRLCLSGDLMDLPSPSWVIVMRALTFYGNVSHLVKEGRTYFYRSDILSYRYPKGWQAVVRVHTSERSALVVVHTFANSPEKVEVRLPMAGWFIQDCLAGKPEQIALEDQRMLVMYPGGDFSAAVILLGRVGS